MTPEKALADALEENKRLREALKFYAAPENWVKEVYTNACGRYEALRIFRHDLGQRARSALQEKK